jgi:hypothetical protein
MGRRDIVPGGPIYRGAVLPMATKTARPRWPGHSRVSYALATVAPAAFAAASAAALSE